MIDREIDRTMKFYDAWVSALSRWFGTEPVSPRIRALKMATK